MQKVLNIGNRMIGNLQPQCAINGDSYRFNAGVNIVTINNIL